MMRKGRALDIHRMTLKDVYGQTYFKLPGRDYYDCLKVVRGLFDDEWKREVTGFYINWSDGYDSGDNSDAVRLQYFTKNHDIAKMIDEFVATEKPKNGLTHRNPIDPAKERNPYWDPPKQKALSGAYGGDDELQIRRFFVTYTLIGLDILEANPENAKRLLATFRFQAMKPRTPEQHCIGTFKRDSRFFRDDLLQADKDQFGKDILNWPHKNYFLHPEPNKNSVDWAHMFVNMVLAFIEWGQLPDYQREFLTVQRPESNAEVNAHLNKIAQYNFLNYGRRRPDSSYAIPPDWKPIPP